MQDRDIVTIGYNLFKCFVFANYLNVTNGNLYPSFNSVVASYHFSVYAKKSLELSYQC